MVQCLPFSQYTGTQVGAPVIVPDALTGRLALARVLRDDWGVAGKTLTIRIYRKIAENWVLQSTGIAESGPSTFKGVAQPNPKMPYIALEDQGEFRVDIETSEAISYSAEVA